MFKEVETYTYFNVFMTRSVCSLWAKNFKIVDIEVKSYMQNPEQPIRSRES